MFNKRRKQKSKDKVNYKPQIPSTIGTLIDAPEDEFTEVIKKLPSLTDVYNVKKSFEVEYQQVETIKDAILKKVDNKELSKNDPVVKGNLDDLYKVLLLLERKCKILEDEKSVRGITQG